MVRFVVRFVAPFTILFRSFRFHCLADAAVDSVLRLKLDIIITLNSSALLIVRAGSEQIPTGFRVDRTAEECNGGELELRWHSQKRRRNGIALDRSHRRVA